MARLLGDGSLERVTLDRHAAGRRLAADLVAADDLPRFDNSAMDGYAVCPGSPDQRSYPVVGDVPAGSAPDFALAPGQAARVMTGARVPDGTVAVVPVERTDASPTGPAPQHVTVDLDPAPGQHVRSRGEDVTAGSVIAAAGSAVTPALIALGRSSGCTTVDVHVPTRVAVVATGAELAPPDADPGAGGIHESNSDMVAALAEAAGCDVRRVEVCSDEPSDLRALLDELDADPGVDVVITTGGVSAGAYEVVRQVCSPLPTFDFVHLAMQPGGPQGLGCFGSTPVVCLPGHTGRRLRRLPRARAPGPRPTPRGAGGATRARGIRRQDPAHAGRTRPVPHERAPRRRDRDAPRTPGTSRRSLPRTASSRCPRPSTSSSTVTSSRSTCCERGTGPAALGCGA